MAAENFQKITPKRKEKEGYINRRFSPRGREISGKSSERYEDRGASAKPPRGYIAKENRSGGTSLRQCLERVWRQGSCPCTLPPKHACSQRAAACNRPFVTPLNVCAKERTLLFYTTKACEVHRGTKTKRAISLTYVPLSRICSHTPEPGVKRMH